MQKGLEIEASRESLRFAAKACETNSMTPMGLAQDANVLENTVVSRSPGTESGTAVQERGLSIETWIGRCPIELPTPIRAAIFAMLKTIDSP